jgi:hypothetical protein
MFVFETLMNIFEKVKFDLPRVDARFRLSVAGMSRPEDTSRNPPHRGDTKSISW